MKHACLPFGLSRPLAFMLAAGLLAWSCDGGDSGSASPPPISEPPPVVVAPPEATVTRDFAPSGDDMPNPDRGFHGQAGDDFVANFDAASVRAAYAQGLRLVLAPVSLGQWRNADLPPDFLSTLGARLAAVRTAGMKAILVFAYDFSPNGLDTSATQIARHLQQLHPVLAANADVIPYMRAGFIGAWGEWHSSRSGNSCDDRSGGMPCSTANLNRAAVRDALLAHVPTTTQVEFRYPSDLQRWYPAGVAPAQVGMHDDCFLAGPDDSGTYAAAGQRAWVTRFTLQASFGGESCDNAGSPIRSTCPDILREGAQYHLAWLNGTYPQALLAEWKAGGCYGAVSASMGYRIQLDRVSHAAAVARGGMLAVGVDVRNTGWSRMFVHRALTIVLHPRDGGTDVVAAAGDLASLSPQAAASTRISVILSVPATAAPGAYDLRLAARDAFPETRSDPRFSVRFANSDQAAGRQSWDPATATLASGTSVQIQ